MAKPPTPNLDGDLPGGLRPSSRATRSTAAQLSEIVDEGRQLMTDEGFRPYRVFSVLERWSGGRIGAGTVKLVRVVEFVPPPYVDFQPLRRKYGGAGTVERGDILLRKISARYTEEELFSLTKPDTAPGEVASIEIQHDGRFDRAQIPRRRRFVISGVPWLDQARFEWIVRMRPQDNARDRRGRPRSA